MIRQKTLLLAMVSCGALSSCSGVEVSAPEPSTDELVKAFREILGYELRERAHRDLQKAADSLAAATELEKQECTSVSDQDWKCEVRYRWAADGDWSDWTAITFRDYSDRNWGILSDRSAFASAAVAALPPLPELSLEKMPVELIGSWIGGGRGNYGLHSDAELVVIPDGATFYFANCRGATTADLRLENGIYPILTDGRCLPTDQMRIAKVTSNNVSIVIGSGSMIQTLELTLANRFGGGRSTPPPTPTDILGLTMSGPNSIKAQIEALRPGRYVGGVGEEISMTALTKDAGSINSYGEIIRAYFAKGTMDAGGDDNPAVAIGRIWVPLNDDAPPYDETLKAVLEKYGPPSLRDGGEYAWYFDEDGGQLHGDGANVCGSAVSFGESRVPVLQFKYQIGGYPMAKRLFARRGCGLSVTARVSARNNGRLGELIIFSYDQKAILGGETLSDLERTRRAIQDAISFQKESANNEVAI